MGYGIIDTSTLTDIADAIREKLGVQTTYKPSEMPEAIESISGGGITPTGTKSITANGTYDVTTFASAQVNVPSSGITPTGTKQINITSNGTTTEDVTAYADAQITVNVPTGSTPTGTKNISITQNGTTTEDVANYANAQISVNVVNQDYEDALVALGVTEDLTDSIEALTIYANGVTGESDTTLSDAVASLADGYGQGGGTSISDGIVVKSRDANGNITSVEKYGDCGRSEFGVGTGGYRYFTYGYLENIVLHNCTALESGAMQNRFIQSITGLENIVSCGENTFMSAGLASISLPSVTSCGKTCFRGLYTTCKSVILPVLQSHGDFLFQQSTDLESVQIGSVGHPAPLTNNQPFYGCTQSNLTITAYQTGANADTLVSNYRRNATGATIIIKASEATTYGGTSYLAGDTILTSTP